MTRLFLFCALIATLVAAPRALSAQDYEATMRDCIQQLADAEEEAEYATLAQQFERIANAEADQWHPYYYQAFCLVARSFQAEGSDARDELVDAAQAALDKAGELAADAGEVAALQARIYQARLSVDPAGRTMTFGPKTTMYLAEAAEKYPRNPRVLFLLGQNLFHTPAAFGGGAERALPPLQGAIALFENVPVTDPLGPSWGQEQAEAVLQQVEAASRK